MSTQPVTHTPDPQRICVIGAGIAGAETALTLAIGLPGARVTLVGPGTSIAVLPNLVYVPFGIDPGRIDVPIADLAQHGVAHVDAMVHRVDVDRRVLVTTAGDIEYDVVVAAPGATPRQSSPDSLRSLEDALRIREQLDALAGHSASATISVIAESDDSWTAPACEMALLLGAWLRASEQDRRIELLLETSDTEVFEWFGREASDIVTAALRRSRVHIATGVPSGRFDELGGDLVIRFGALEARRIDGLPGWTPAGWYRTDRDFRVAPNTFVVGDAIDLPYRAGFATAWQARRVLAVLGGDLRRLGMEIDGIPRDCAEYQMDLADSVLRARVTHADHFGHPFLGHDADVSTVAGARPDKLAGLLLHDRVIRWRATHHDAPLAYRDALRARTERRPLSAS